MLLPWQQLKYLVNYSIVQYNRRVRFRSWVPPGINKLSMRL